MRFLIVLCFAATTVCASGAFAEQPFLGPIPVQYVASGKDLALDMRRFFHPGPGGKLDVAANDDVDVSFDRAAFQLRVRPKKTGLFDIALTTGTGKEAPGTILTLASESPVATHRFTFKPPGAVTKVYLAGIFNGWSTDQTPLTGPNENGEYVADLALEPGRYSYKFVVDGKWTPDPANPKTEEDGMGGTNSVLTIEAGKAAAAPSIYADQLTPKSLKIRLVPGGAAVARVSAIFETADGSTVVPATTKGDEIEIAVPEGKNGFVRAIAVDAKGAVSNVVRCPAGPSGKFRWQDAILYYAFTDRFANGDKSNDKPVDNPNVLAPANYHGGDLRGVRNKIEDGYFERLGINTIWVAPLNRNPAGAYQEHPEPRRWYTGYHGYWPVSSTDIDPHIGSEGDLRGLIDAAHARGMKVIADLVLHHVHEEHPWWKEHRDWFGTLDLPGGKKNLRLWDEQQFTTWFEPYLPSFDFSKDAAVRALIDNSVWWANTYKLDGFRLDAVKHILPSFWWKFRAAIREQVDRKRESPFYLVGETFKDRAGINLFVGPNMLDGQFDFPLYDQIKDTFALGSGGMKVLEDSLTSSEKIYGRQTLMSPLVGNHDKGRFLAFADGDLPDKGGAKEEEVGWKNPPKIDDGGSFAKLKLAQAFLMSIDGVPMVYYGDEIGMTGAGDPDNRRDMRFGNDVSEDEKRVLLNFEKLGALRRAHPALRYGSRRQLIADQDTYAFVRAHLDDRVVAIFNRGKNEANVSLNVAPELADGDYIDALGGTAVAVKNGKLDFKLGGQKAAFVTKKK